MKNLSLIINAVLAVALGVLFILHFSLRNDLNYKKTHAVTTNVGGGNIVYVNMDSLYNRYDEYVDLKAQMDEKQKRMSVELSQKGASFENKAADFQDKVQKGLLLRSDAEKMQQQLLAEQQNLAKLNENMQNQLAEELQVINRKLYNNIVEFLSEYNKDGRFKFVFSHAYGGSLLYVNDSLDITHDVITGLNEKYRKSKNK